MSYLVMTSDYLVHYERPEGEEKDMEHLIENSINRNGTDFDDIPAISLTSSVAQPECIDKTELKSCQVASRSSRDLGLSKEFTELLASRLSEKHVLKPGANISFYQYIVLFINKEYRGYFQEDGLFVICIDIKSNFCLSTSIFLFINKEYRLYFQEDSVFVICIDIKRLLSE